MYWPGFEAVISRNASLCPQTDDIFHENAGDDATKRSTFRGGMQLSGVRGSTG